MNNELEQKYIDVINNNVNVGKSSALGEFAILIAGLIGLCLVLFLFADNISSFLIDKMSNKTQIKLEKYLPNPKFETKNESSEKIKLLEEIKPYIISLDKNLQNKSEFKIYETPQKEVNAFVTPNGTIFLTEGLLNKVEKEETLAFILAHEMGHYAHRDHLKSISRELVLAIIKTIITFGQQDLNTVVGGISSINDLSHSRKQEEQADKYAVKVLVNLYGDTKGAEEFFELLEKESEVPELFYYFSTHPSTKQRLKSIKNR